MRPNAVIKRQGATNVWAYATELEQQLRCLHGKEVIVLIKHQFGDLRYGGERFGQGHP